MTWESEQLLGGRHMPNLQNPIRAGQRQASPVRAEGHAKDTISGIEPFEPRHIVAAVKEVLGGKELVEVLSTEPGWQTEHPTGTSGDWGGRKVLAGALATAGSRAHAH